MGARLSGPGGNGVLCTCGSELVFGEHEAVACQVCQHACCFAWVPEALGLRVRVAEHDPRLHKGTLELGVRPWAWVARRSRKSRSHVTGRGYFQVSVPAV